LCFSPVHRRCLTTVRTHLGPLLVNLGSYLFGTPGGTFFLLLRSRTGTGAAVGGLPRARRELTATTSPRFGPNSSGFSCSPPSAHALVLIWSRSRPLRPDPIDGIIEAIIFASTQPARSLVIVALSRETSESVAGLPTDPASGQLVSICRGRNEAAAQRHRLGSSPTFSTVLERGPASSWRRRSRQTEL
jgi:hypothetical protein